ncbi:MAG: hypothetical protein KAJ78_02660 [Acidobacteria bacterium]|nr:hypothetical protein [Acidobacteriota bacterium]
MRRGLICCLLTSLVIMTGLGATEVSAEDIFGFALAEAAGAGGTLWLSDLEVLAIGPEDAVYTIEFLDGTASPPQLSKTLEADQAVRFANILGSEFGLSNTFGGFRIAATAGILRVGGRTVNDSPNGSYGSNLHARSASAALGVGEQGYLIQLAQNASYHTNLGLLNTGAVPLVVDVDYRLADGTLLGTDGTVLAVNQYRQINQVFLSVTGDDVDDGYLVVSTSTADGSFLAAAYVINNGSGDPATVPSIDGVAAEPLFLPFAADVGDFGTDLEILAASAATVELALLPSGTDNSAPATVGYVLAAGEALRVADVLVTAFSTTGTAALRVTPTTGSVMVNGIGQQEISASLLRHIPATAESEAFSFENASLLMGLEDSTEFGTDAGAVSAGTEPIVMAFDLYRADGTLLGRAQRTLAPYGHVLIADLFDEVTTTTVSNGIAVVRTLTPGGRFVPFATVTDLQTGDSRHIPGQAYDGALASLLFADAFESGDTFSWSSP